MIRQLERIEDLERIRITSIEPTTIEHSLVEHMAESKKLCHYFHIPLQSAHADVLDGMNRRYTPDDYRAFVEQVLTVVPDVGLGTDVIVGFPGETDERFESTYRFIESLPFAYLHVFSYSKRYGTKAARHDGHVGSNVIKERSQALRDLSARKKRAFGERFLGNTVEVLFEQQDESGLWTGLTGNYLRVGVVSPEPLKNTIRSVVVNEVTDEIALGTIEGRTGDRSPSRPWETVANPRNEPLRRQ